MSNDETRIIGDPGKFEGEPVYVRDYFYARMMEGLEDETIYDSDTPIAVFYLDDDERNRFELDESDYAFLLWEDDNGFVYGRTINKPDLHAFRMECESAEEEED